MVFKQTNKKKEKTDKQKNKKKEIENKGTNKQTKRENRQTDKQTPMTKKIMKTNRHFEEEISFQDIGSECSEVKN